MYSDKIAIAVLTKGYDDIRQYQMLIDRNNSIFDKIVSHSKYQFDMLIFHEGNITTEHQEYIASQSKLPLLFKNVKEHGNCSAFDDTRNKLNMELCPPTGLSSWFSLGYKHMCHFWSIEVTVLLTRSESNSPKLKMFCVRQFMQFCPILVPCSFLSIFHSRISILLFL